jgi:hypothetical protein
MTHRNAQRLSVVLALTIVSMLSGRGSRAAQPPRPNPVFLDDLSRARLAAAIAVALHDPIASSSVLAYGQHTQLWEATPLEGPPKTPLSDKAAPIDPDVLIGVEDREPVRNAAQNLNEYQAYTYTLLQAHKTPAAALAKAARHDLSYVHLMEEPAKHRGQIVHIEGRLRRLLKFDTNRTATREGLPTMYEAWIFPEEVYSDPYCVLISELPRGISPGERLLVPVAVDAYFFKRYRYRAKDRVRDAPLLIGRTLTPLVAETPAAPVDPSIPHGLLWSFLSLVGLTFVLGIGIALWFRRGDRQVRQQLDRHRTFHLE